MKKLLLALVVGLAAVSLVQARYRRGVYRRGRNWSSQRGSRCAPRCAPKCAPVRCEPRAPKCYKNIMVPVTVEECRQIEVPARKIVIPQPDLVECIPQPAIEVRTPQPPIPQPDIITYKCVPDKIVHHKQPPCIRYECPADCN